MIETMFIRTILHLVAAMAFISLATAGDWRNSASARLYAVTALYFLGSSFRIMVQNAGGDPAYIADYFLTPILLIISASAWWAVFQLTRQRK